MALTVTKDMPKVERISRNLGMLTGSILFDSSYPTGGEADTLITNYFKTTLQILIESEDGWIFKWDKANSKIMAYAAVSVVAGSGTSGANNTIMKSATSTLEVAGTGTAFQLGAQEVLNTTDLSGATVVKFIAIGLI